MYFYLDFGLKPVVFFCLTNTIAPSPNQKIFVRMQATRLAAPFELLARSVALTEPEKFPRKATCISVFFFVKIPKTGRMPKC